MFTQTLALAAAVLGVVQSLTLLGQARTLRRIGSAREVSLPFLTLAVLCSIAWLLYGTLHGDAALVAVNSVGLTGAATTLITAVRLRAADSARTRPGDRVTGKVATAKAATASVATASVATAKVAADRLTIPRRLRPRRQPAWADQLSCDRQPAERSAVAAEDELRSPQLAMALTG
jgi:uncharacterized protein with PQ loop repeat